MVQSLRLVLRALPFFLLPFLLTPVAASANWNFEKVSGNTLKFKNEKTGNSESLKTDVPAPEFIAVLTDPESNTPYALYEGKTCAKCDVNNKSIFLQRLDGKGKATTFVYPGNIVDETPLKKPKKGVAPKDGKARLVAQRQFFYGHCLPSVKQGVVIHQGEAVDRRGFQRSVVIAEPGPQYVYEVLLERRLPSLKTTRDLVKKKVCVEIAGRDRKVLRKPLDLTPKKGLDDDEDEDEDVKEKIEEKGEAPSEA